QSPCTLIHVDPRFTRTSAMANVYAPLRAGSDIVFLGALINYVLQRHEPIFDNAVDALPARERFFHDYLVHYTNAATLITDEFKDTEDLQAGDEPPDGLFAGFQPAKKKYDVKQWRYETEPAKKPGSQSEPGEGKAESFSAQVAKLVGPRPREDRTLRHPRCV